MLRQLVVCHKWQQCDVACALDGNAQVALLALGQAGLLARLDLSVYVYVTLQGLNVLVVKIWYIAAMFKNLCHTMSLRA